MAAEKLQPDVEIGVIYTHEDQFMPALLGSLSQSAPGLKSRLLLVDNCSRSGAERWLPLFRETQIIRNDMRLGYAANLNRILSASTAPFVLLLNTDMYFDPDQACVARMVEFMQRHPDCGIAGCRLYHADNSYAFPARRFQTMKAIAGRRLGLAGVFQDEVRDYLYQSHSSLDSYSCEWLSGCLLMVRRELWQQIGGLDTGFRKYFEDVDYCLRAAVAGWRVMFHGGTYAYHLEQRASRHLWSRDAWRHLRSYGRWLSKWGFNPRRHVGAVRPRVVEQPRQAA